MTPPAPLPQPSARPRTCAIAVIAKAPRPGHVKTRLQAILQPDEAAAMGAAFLRDTLQNLVEAGRHVPIAPFVAYAPAGQEARFDGMLPPGTELLLADGANGDAPGVHGFGRVLLDATRALLARGYAAACVLGADSPTLPTATLVRCADALLTGRADAVLGAAEDGGYYILGLTEPHAAPYADIAWSTDVVAAQTRDRLAHLRLEELDRWYDVDDPASLTRLVRDITAPSRAPPCATSRATTPYPAHHTAALVDRLRLPERLSQFAA